MKSENSPTAMQLAADIVVALLGRTSVDPDRLPNLIREIRRALVDGAVDGPERTVLGEATAARGAVHVVGARAAELPDGGVAQPGLLVDRPVETDASMGTPDRAQPAVPVEESITPDYLISLEDGQRYRSLRRHLMAKYGMTPDQYREKWSLPRDYPMVAPTYAKERSEVAKRIGLGRTKVSEAAAPSGRSVSSRAKTARASKLQR